MVPDFGSGTLGYVSFVKESSGSFLGASGLLLAEVHFRNRCPERRVSVTARLIPSIGELALEAEEGTLLHRSQTASSKRWPDASARATAL